MHLGIIPFLLLFIPILEITVFILIGGQIGVALTLGMILVTAIVGSILLRIQGFATLARIQQQSKDGAIPGKELVSGVMILIAGVLLLTPGFVTDSIGFLLFIPPFRHFLWSTIASKVVVQTKNSFGQGGNPFENAGHRGNQEDIVDLDPSEFSEKENPNSPWNKLDDK